MKAKNEPWYPSDITIMLKLCCVELEKSGLGEIIDRIEDLRRWWDEQKMAYGLVEEESHNYENTRKLKERRQENNIETIYIGEHVGEIAKDMCKWLRNCLHIKLSPSRFRRIWTRYLESEEASSNTFGLSIIDGEECYWNDALDLSEGDLCEFYERSNKMKADQFLVFNNNAYINIVSVKGHPTYLEIADVVLGMENIQGMTENECKSEFFDD